MNKLKEKLDKNEFVYTAELCPPKGTNLENFLEKADILKNVVDAINVTDNQRAMMRLSTMAAAHLIKKKNIDVIVQMTCRDRNRIALQSDLLGISALGIKNILALTGDYVTAGDHPQAKPVFDLDSTLLIKTACMMSEGRNIAGSELKGKTDFYIGAAVNPSAEPFAPQKVSFERKIKAGASFFQTQAIFDIDRFRNFMSYAKSFPVKIIAGILLIKSPEMAKFLNEKVAGVSIPASYIERLSHSSAPLQTGIEIAKEQVETMKSLCHGVHIMTIGKEEKVKDILTDIS